MAPSSSFLSTNQVILIHEYSFLGVYKLIKCAIWFLINEFSYWTTDLMCQVETSFYYLNEKKSMIYYKKFVDALK